MRIIHSHTWTINQNRCIAQLYTHQYPTRIVNCDKSTQRNIIFFLSLARLQTNVVGYLNVKRYQIENMH